MADRLFSVYCKRDAIEGMHGEKALCSKLLALAEPKERAMALIYMNQTNEWVYGQCNFKHKQDDQSNYKFSDTFAALRQQNVLPTLIRQHAVSVIFFVDSTLAERVSADNASSRFSDLVCLISQDTVPLRRPTPKPQQSLLSKLKNRLTGS